MLSFILEKCYFQFVVDRRLSCLVYDTMNVANASLTSVKFYNMIMLKQTSLK